MKDSGSIPKTLLVIIACALLIRILYVLTLGEELIFPDSARYDRIARGILAGEGFPDGRTAPLYPLFLAGIYTFPGRSFFAVRLSQAIIECFSVLLVFKLSRGIFSARAGLFASGIYAFYPFFIFFSGLILTETLFIMLFLLLILLLRNTARAPCLKNAIPAGAAGGVIILIKPVMLYFIPVFLLFATIISCRKKELLASSLMVILFMLAASSPWPAYTRAAHGRASLISASSITWYESFNPRATGGPGQELIEWTEEMKQMDEDEIERHFRREALKFIIKNPGRALQLVYMKQARFWSPVPNFEDYRNLRYGLISFLTYTPVLLLAAWLVVSRGRKWKEYAHICLPVAFFALLHTVVLGSIRYRVPVDPFIIILASGKISDFHRGKFKQDGRELARPPIRTPNFD